jgi:hypothetical protein
MSIRFEVRVNGAVVCIAGIEGDGVASITLDRVKRVAARYPENFHRKRYGCSQEEWSREKTTLQVGGLRCRTKSPKRDQHVFWHGRELQPGDEVSIRVLSEGEIDLPEAD